ncbi:gamma-butyrobetaine dioxygenase [Coprinopsis cinerea okayama7|uniref:Gamma-butyrobetaine dioxygenase n=1 Tax=Coprinopsis cinerea (strain Okayama-7 / 130 / ATCC MYA-4618 / FGSC 9003) TaxID=240176 RepID=D6RN57_COPC7|nr:gamma-butyrobetaine dioxygenase [Coprinopsis cinerea okayama7\|eukprot:XP_002911012.1 gamma-butyrobetaine dioxygenase [Coprinopsis cinerea okayama7\
MFLTTGARALRRFASGSSSVARSRTWTSVTTAKDGLKVHSLNDTVFPYVWLRDSCQGPESVHPSNRQKLHRSSDIPLDIKPVEVKEGESFAAGRPSAGVKVAEEGIEIRWVDGRTSFFHRDFLKTHASTSALYASHLVEYTSPTPWTLETVTKTPSLFVPYESLQETRGLVGAMTQLLKYGLVFVTGVPTEGKTNDECELKKLANRFGEIRETFYGELWDVININNSKNIAYTNLDLGLHMDLLYFQHPPRFQALHCLRNRVIGGTSVFVDALQASHALFHANREHFDLLTRTPVAFQYVNDGHHLYMQHPTIQLEDARDIHSYSTSSAVPPPISHINYSPPFQGPLPLNTPREFFPALKHFSDILNDPKNTYTYTLREGDCVLFDNRRVLHARTAFEEKTGNDREEGLKFGSGDATTNRWLKGCYLEADAVADRMRVGRTKLGLL